MLVEFICSSSYNCESSWLNMEYIIDTTRDLLTQLSVSSNVDRKTLLEITKKDVGLTCFIRLGQHYYYLFSCSIANLLEFTEIARFQKFKQTNIYKKSTWELASQT